MFAKYDFAVLTASLVRNDKANELHGGAIFHHTTLQMTVDVVVRGVYRHVPNFVMHYVPPASLLIYLQARTMSQPTTPTTTSSPSEP
jgi:hypothetical protein